ncbi:hypothetical protein [Pandoraea captiosa]|nr:hypothetical protein [Pandoraea captiosa]
MRQMRRAHLETLLANQAHPEKDRTGSATNSVAGSLRFLAVADFVLDGDVSSFRGLSAKAANQRLSLLVRGCDGEQISPSYLSMSNFKSMLTALAAGEFSLAYAIAQNMTAKYDSYDDALTRALGRSIKYAVLDEPDEMRAWTDRLVKVCEKNKYSAFHGYASTMQSIAGQDVEGVRNGLASIVAGHSKLCRPGALFSYTEDELLCMWGIGMSNLAASRGLHVELDHALIPRELMVQPQGA